MTAQAIPDDQKLQGISIDNMVLKEGLNEVLTQMIEGLIGLIKFSIKLESEHVEEYIGNVMGKLEAKPSNMEQLGEVMREFDKIKLNEQEIMDKIKRI